MKNIKSFNLINELFQNSIIIKQDYSVIYQGSRINDIFFENRIDIRQVKNTQFKQHNEFLLLRDTIRKVLVENTPCIFKFTKLDEELLLFKTDPGKDASIIMGFKDKITHFSRIEFDLNERVKELQCLYNISQELEDPESLPVALENCIGHIKQGFLRPEETEVIIEIRKKAYGKTGWDTSEAFDAMKKAIKLNGDKVGEISVYLKHNAGFLDEELRLIEEIAHVITRVIEKDKEESNFEKQQKILKAKNASLLRLTEECHNARQRERTFFRAITDRIVVVDNKLNIIMSNKDEIGDSGKCHKKLFNSDEICAGCPAMITFNKANINLLEKELDDKFFRLRTYPILGSDGQVESVLEVCRDITEQKIMQEQLLQSYKLASLGKLVAGVAHEINNPNTFILGNLKIIKEAFEDLFPIMEEYSITHPGLKIARLNYDVFKENIYILVNDMINGANRTKKIVADLRNFAKKDDGSLIEDIDLNYLITNNLTLTQKHIKKYAELEIELSENIPTFKGNMSKLEQVFLNLVMNASEAIENGHGLIKILTGFDKTKSEVLLIIIDNGCGMDDTTKKNIFDPFFTTKRNKGGTGLGLSITYGIVKDHEGKIEVESKIGEGTKFTIRFPAKTGGKNDKNSSN